MNTKALWLAMAGAFAGAALLLVYMKRFEKQTSGGAPIPVLFAVQDIPLGTVVSEDMIAVRNLPEAYLEDRHIKASESSRVIGVSVRSSLKAEESVLWTDLATASEGSRDLSSLVQHGMRAVTIPAKKTSTFGGLLRPGDRVDVLFHGAGKTIPLLQNVLILAAGSDTGKRNRSGARAFSQVTLSVSLKQAQVLAHATSRGELTLILRNPDDIKLLKDLPGASSKDLTQSHTNEAESNSASLKTRKEIEHVN